MRSQAVGDLHQFLHAVLLLWATPIKASPPSALPGAVLPPFSSRENQRLPCPGPRGILTQSQAGFQGRSGSPKVCMLCPVLTRKARDLGCRRFQLPRLQRGICRGQQGCLRSHRQDGVLRLPGTSRGWPQGRPAVTRLGETHPWSPSQGLQKWPAAEKHRVNGAS